MRTVFVFQLKRKGEKITSMLNPTPDFLEVWASIPNLQEIGSWIQH